MSVLLAASVFVVLAPVAGFVFAAVIAGIPIEILSRAAVGGRYAGLAAGEPTSPVGPASGRRVAAFAAAVGAAA
jgi:hypothetical protein